MQNLASLLKLTWPGWPCLQERSPEHTSSHFICFCLFSTHEVFRWILGIFRRKGMCCYNSLGISPSSNKTSWGHGAIDWPDKSLRILLQCCSSINIRCYPVRAKSCFEKFGTMPKSFMPSLCLLHDCPAFIPPPQNHVYMTEHYTFFKKLGVQSAFLQLSHILAIW